MVRERTSREVSPDFSVLKEHLSDYDVDEGSARPVTEGVWYADRTGVSVFPGLGTTARGLFWTHSGSHVVSLAYGDGLHGWDGIDYETYVFAPRDVDVDVHCHDTYEEAEACALTFIREGHWCAK